MENGENQKKSPFRIISICSIIFIVIFTMANIQGVQAVLSSIFSVLTPVFIGLALAYIFNPLLRLYEYKVFKKLKNKNFIRGISITLTFITAFLILTAFLWLLIPQVISSSKDLIANYDNYVNSTVNLINSTLSRIITKDHLTEYISADEVTNLAVEFFTSSSQLMGSLFSYVSDFAMGLFVGIKNTIIGIFIAIYMLISKERLQAVARKLGTAFMSDKQFEMVEKYVRVTHNTFTGFFVGKIIDSAIILLLTLVLLLIFRIDYPLLIAVIVGVTNIIPVFGPFIGAIPSFFLLFIIDPKEAFIFLILIILIQQLDGNVIGPKILGDSTGISSLGVLIAIIVMGEYFGIVGMIIGVPIFAVCGVIIDEIADAKLTKRGKTTHLDEYYHKDAMIDPSIKHQPILWRIFGRLYRSLFKGVRARKIKKAKDRSEE